MNLPKCISLANLPTPIQPLERLSAELGVSISVKRDDFTGMEVSGNKVRKLEFAVALALEQGADVLVTCGGLQSNHARATAAVARKLGLECHLVLRGKPEEVEGNLFLDLLLGAKVTFLEAEVFNSSHLEVMEELKRNYERMGKKAYLLPMGASNAIGSFGYFKAYKEILSQDIFFDNIVCAVGSGGTQAGLVLGNILHGYKHQVYGIPIVDDSRVFGPVVRGLVGECLNLMGMDSAFDEEAIKFLDGYAGRGYALNTREELAFIRNIARLEGILFDPVYTGKAFRGMVEEVKKGTLQGRTLFIHTGGLYGLFPKAMEFMEVLDEKDSDYL